MQKKNTSKHTQHEKDRHTYRRTENIQQEIKTLIEHNDIIISSLSLLLFLLLSLSGWTNSSSTATESEKPFWRQTSSLTCS